MKKNRCVFGKDKLLNPESVLHICEKNTLCSSATHDKTSWSHMKHKSFLKITSIQLIWSTQKDDLEIQNF